MYVNRILLTVALSLGLTALLAQNMEMHAEKSQALALVEEAMVNMGHDMMLFGANVDKAAATDPSMVVANFFAAMNPDLSKEEARPFMENVQAYRGETSPGEAILVEMSSHFDEEDYNFFQSFAKLAEAYPQDARVNLMVGASFMYGGRSADGIPYLQKAIDLGDMLGAYNMLGYAYMESGDMDAAKGQFDTYLRMAPEHYNPHDSMGDFYMATENYEAAAASYEKAAGLNPDFPGHAEKAAKAREMMDR